VGITNNGPVHLHKDFSSFAAALLFAYLKDKQAHLINQYLQGGVLCVRDGVLLGWQCSSRWAQWLRAMHKR
jgi:hypothetical protein